MIIEILIPQLKGELSGVALKQRVTATIDDLISQLPRPETMDAETRRGIIARYGRGAGRQLYLLDDRDLPGRPCRGCAADF